MITSRDTAAAPDGRQHATATDADKRTAPDGGLDLQRPLNPRELRYHHSTVMRVVCRVFETSRLEICSQRKSRHVVLPRQAAMLLLRDYTWLSLTAIARMINRDHTTVMYGARMAARRRRKDREFAWRVALAAEILDSMSPEEVVDGLRLAPHDVVVPETDAEEAAASVVQPPSSVPSSRKPKPVRTSAEPDPAIAIDRQRYYFDPLTPMQDMIKAGSAEYGRRLALEVGSAGVWR